MRGKQIQIQQYLTDDTDWCQISQRLNPYEALVLNDVRSQSTTGVEMQLLPVRSVFIDGRPSRNYIWRASSIEIDQSNTHPSVLNGLDSDGDEDCEEDCEAEGEEEGEEEREEGGEYLRGAVTDEEAEPADSTHLLDHPDRAIPGSLSGSLGRPRNRVKLGTSALKPHHDSGFPETSNSEESQEGQAGGGQEAGGQQPHNDGRVSNRNSRASSSSCVCNNNVECSCGAGAPSHYSTCSSGASTLMAPPGNTNNNSTMRSHDNSTMRSCDSNVRSMASVPLSVKSRAELLDSLQLDSVGNRTHDDNSDGDYSLVQRPLENVPEGECLGFASESNREPMRPRRRSRSRSPGGRKSRGSRGSTRARNAGKLPANSFKSGHHDIPRRMPAEAPAASPGVNYKRLHPGQELVGLDLDSANDVNKCPVNYEPHGDVFVGTDPSLPDFAATSDPLYAEYGPFQQATSSSDEPISNRSSRVYI
ncbi:PREDICTED: uncharacterized protein LOC106806211 [Priapulus caudatus]|uniref:Uncharacterized protein LOC106806211 n=1 Tax=Priapulus caudatus TaxID=37621 RepID=A0ABM1DUF0_PRICU|nr:PREDICTED: uncharacterized protein LOC106806211 [Priapulus caudatus]